MKYTIAVAALLYSVSAVKLRFTDDLMKSLAEDMEKDSADSESLAQAPQPVAEKKPAAPEKKDAKAQKLADKKGATKEAEKPKEEP